MGEEGKILTKTQFLIQRLSSKKFYFSLFVILLITVLLFLGLVDKSIWKEFVQWIATVFLGADASQEVGKHVANNMRKDRD